MSRAHSPTFPSLHLRHSSFSNPSVALPKSQLILQPFRCFTYVTAHSPTLLSLLLSHWLFTYVTWRDAQVKRLVLKGGHIREDSGQLLQIVAFYDRRRPHGAILLSIPATIRGKARLCFTKISKLSTFFFRNKVSLFKETWMFHLVNAYEV